MGVKCFGKSTRIFYPRLIYNLLQNKNKQCQTVLVHLQSYGKRTKCTEIKWNDVE